MIDLVTGITIDYSRLEAIKARVLDLRPVFISEVQPLITDFFQKQFDSEGAYGGSKWAALAPSTIEGRKLPGHGRGGIGRDTDSMWASLTKSGGSVAGPDAYLRITPIGIERGSTLKRAMWFQDGRKGQPARHIMPYHMPTEFVQRVDAAVMNYVMGQAR